MADPMPSPEQMPPLPCPFCNVIPKVTQWGVCCETDGCPAESGGFGTVEKWNERPLSVPPGEDATRLNRLNELLGPSPMDALQSAFIAGMDKCREVQTAYGEWPSLEGRCEMARDAFPDDDSLISTDLTSALPLRDLALRADTLARNVAQYPERIPDLIAATNALYEAAAHSSSSVPCPAMREFCANIADKFGEIGAEDDSERFASQRIARLIRETPFVGQSSLGEGTDTDIIAKFGARITELERQRSELRGKIRGLAKHAHYPDGVKVGPKWFVPLDDVLEAVGWDIAALQRDAGRPVEEIVARSQHSTSETEKR